MHILNNFGRRSRLTLDHVLADPSTDSLRNLWESIKAYDCSLFVRSNYLDAKKKFLKRSKNIYTHSAVPAPFDAVKLM